MIPLTINKFRIICLCYPCWLKKKIIVFWNFSEDPSEIQTVAKIVAAYSQIDIKKAQEYLFHITGSHFHTPSRITEAKKFLHPGKKQNLNIDFL